MFHRLCFFSALAFLTIASVAQAAERPNIVVIFTDDQGWNDVGCYGSEIPTPHIDSLARDGMKFTHWYVASSICTPSRYGLLTGRNPSRSKDRLLGALMYLGDEDKTKGIHQGETTVASVLKGAGYHTGLIGKWHLGHGDKSFFPTRHGFDEYVGHTAGCIDFFTMSYGNSLDWFRNETLEDQVGYATDLITDEAERFFKERAKAEKPFFLHLAYNAPHFGKGWNDGKNETVNILQPHPKDLARVAFIEDPTRRKFAAMVVSLDDGVGRVLASLKKNGLEENTLVIFMTDHGGDPNYGGSNAPLRGDKATLFDGGVRVPCLMRWPARIKAGSSCSEVAWALDILPTFAALAGTKTGNLRLDGMDIQSVFDGGKLGEREMYWELGRHAELKRGRWMSLRKGGLKYLHDNDGNEYLFDLNADPREQKNLSNARKKVFDALRERTFELAEIYRNQD